MTVGGVMEMKTSLETYRQGREALLAKIVTELSNDERFVAAWLTGSYGRNNEDKVSDLDLRLVVAEPYSELLCRRQEQVSHRTTQERFELFSRFGSPVLIHENLHLCSVCRLCGDDRLDLDSA
jgi:predicted nucleotidyltransferase